MIRHPGTRIPKHQLKVRSTTSLIKNSRVACSKVYIRGLNWSGGRTTRPRLQVAGARPKDARGMLTSCARTRMQLLEPAPAPVHAALALLLPAHTLTPPMEATASDQEQLGGDDRPLPPLHPAKLHGKHQTRVHGRPSGASTDLASGPDALQVMARHPEPGVQWQPTRGCRQPHPQELTAGRDPKGSHLGPGCSVRTQRRSQGAGTVSAALGARRVSRGHWSEGSSSFPELSWCQAPGHRAGIKGRGRLSPALGTQEDACPQEQPEQPGRTAE
uniref:Uncharacterized protein n=1 Tax=Rangifer tarandus platyrhynchus TaxID=3082113 RepID=A0ACB0DPI6_RANTA|nr:unnamed protein product [Rangifer tarandus platyrhynchus]